MINIKIPKKTTVLWLLSDSLSGLFRTLWVFLGSGLQIESQHFVFTFDGNVGSYPFQQLSILKFPGTPVLQGKDGEEGSKGILTEDAQNSIESLELPYHGFSYPQP